MQINPRQRPAASAEIGNSAPAFPISVAESDASVAVSSLPPLSPPPRDP